MSELPRIVSARGKRVTVEMDYATLADIAGSLSDAAYMRMERGFGELHPGVKDTAARAAAFDRLCDEFTEGLDASGMS